MVLWKGLRRSLVGLGSSAALVVFCDDSPPAGTYQYLANKFIEDRIFVDLLRSKGPVQYFLVLDGHGGPQAAEFMTRELPKLFSELTVRGFSLAECMRRSFLQADANWYGLVRPAYDAGFTGPIKVGACAVCVAVSDTEIIVGSVGDCKCVLAKGDSSVIDLNIQRNANLESEQARLRALHPNEEDVVKCKRSWQEPVVVAIAQVDSGASSSWFRKWTTAKSVDTPTYVTKHSGCYVKGRLQPTKSFGDFHLKKSTVHADPERGRPFLDPSTPKSYPYIDADPDITVTPRSAIDQFLVIATDGLWDQFTSEEAVELVRGFLKETAESTDRAAELLVRAALAHAAQSHSLTVQDLQDIPPGSARRNLHDDISVCIVRL